MSLIDSSTRSPLSSLSTSDIDDVDELEIEPEEEPERLEVVRSGTLKHNLIAQVDDINIARSLGQHTLDEIGQTVIREYEIDENSRADWKDKAERAMKFATQESQPKSFPWAGSSSIVFPLITQATIQFNARTYPAIIPGRNIVKGVVWGSDQGTPVTMDGTPDGQPKIDPQTQQPVWLVAPGERRERADRIGEYMSFQLLKEMPEWEPQTDQLLMQLPIVGGAVRKTYYDPAEDCNKSLFVSIMKLVWNYHAPSFEAAPRHSEILSLYPHEIVEYERAGAEGDDDEGMFLPLNYGPGGDPTEDDGADQGDPDAPHVFIEQHRRWDLDEDGYAEPYVVTVHKRSAKVVRIVARYDEDGIDATKSGKTINKIKAEDQYTLIPFLPNAEGGSYPMGFGHLLQPLNKAINTSLDQMFDAATLQNAGGGFIGDQLGIPSGQTLFTVGKYTRVTTKGQAIRDSVFPLPFQGPSPVLFQLLGLLLSAGKEVASIQEILAGDAAIANAPPTTVLALIEQGTKVYTAIHKRVYRAFASEFQKLYRLNRIYLKETRKYQVGDEWSEITPDDFRLGGGVEPVADPTMVTDMQRLIRAEVAMSMIDLGTINKLEATRRKLEAANIDRIDELLQTQPPAEVQQAQQMAMAMQQAELGRTRAAEQKDATQAFLNLALARAKATGPEVEQINAQLEMLRLHIEALNTINHAAEIEGKHHIDLHKVRNDARSIAIQQQQQSPDGDQGAGVAGLEAPPDNGGLPPVPIGPSPAISGTGSGPLGGGPAGP